MNYLIHFINSIFLPEIIRQHGGKILIVLRLILIPRLPIYNRMVR